MKEAIRQLARELGFDDCRFTSAAPPASSPKYEEWIAAERHGLMGYLARNAHKRVDPQQVLPGARSVICLAISYAPSGPVEHLPGHGVVARYARHLDYHDIIGDKLKEFTARLDELVTADPGRAALPGRPLQDVEGDSQDKAASEHATRSRDSGTSETPAISQLSPTNPGSSVTPNASLPLAPLGGEDRGEGASPDNPARPASESLPQHRSLWYIDTGPVLERDFAQRAGIGFVGKHTNVISRKLGNWIFLAEILTTAEFEPDSPETNKCGKCTSCIQSCPTQAITAPFQLDARKCISYLTIELKGSIPEELRPAIGNRIFGCDDCLAACPWNRFAKEGNLMREHRRSDLTAPELIDLLGIDQPEFRRRYKGTPFERSKRRGLLRNVCVALGNTGDASALPALRRATGDPEPLIAEHAQWAIDQIEARVPASE